MALNLTSKSQNLQTQKFWFSLNETKRGVEFFLKTKNKKQKSKKYPPTFPLNLFFHVKTKLWKS